MSESTDPIPQMGHVKDGEVKQYTLALLRRKDFHRLPSEIVPESRFVTLAAYNELKEERDRLALDINALYEGADDRNEDNAALRSRTEAAEAQLAQATEMAIQIEEESRDVPKLRVELAAARADAERYQALRQYLTVARHEPGEWTCWLELACIPTRSQTTDPQDRVDWLVKVLKERAALTSLEGGQKPN